MKRLQLTLFLDKNQSKDFENIRKKYNPIQYELIKCHITLCREDELLDLNQLKFNLQNLQFEPLRLHFGEPQRFSDGNGVFLPVFGEAGLFQDLRRCILDRIIENPREHKAHLTLMHPRNSTCTDAIFQEITNTSLPKNLIFEKISLIEQINEEKWEVLEEFEMN